MKKILLIFSKPKRPWTIVQVRLGVPYFVNIFASLLLHMLEGKTYKSTVVIELKQKDYQADLCKRITRIAPYQTSKGNYACRQPPSLLVLSERKHRHQSREKWSPPPRETSPYCRGNRNNEKCRRLRVSRSTPRNLFSKLERWRADLHSVVLFVKRNERVRRWFF